ncbi:fatty acid-binding protein, liver-like [Physella acuta]|uniref:fatty acid-binding protein, liver-like n=1 Tax=Physella acuta TaxID=109671 RepID=UPI0027DCD80B|nr:fatty acid-binding protein, liver-like [Physella acuta]
MEAFYGLWTVDLSKTSGVAEIGKLFGWTEDKIQAFSTTGYTLLIEASGDGNRCLVDYGVVKMEFNFKLGEPFDYTGLDGVKAKCTVELSGSGLVENFSTAEGATWKTTREVTGNNMKATTVFGGQESVKCVQEFKKN